MCVDVCVDVCVCVGVCVGVGVGGFVNAANRRLACGYTPTK